MENTNDITQIIIDTINHIFENLFSSIDNNLYSVLDNITFINSNILNDKNFENIFGTSTTNGILLISNSLLLAFMNCSFFIISFILDLNFNISLAIRSIGENLFGKSICFSELITSINSQMSINTTSLNIFSLDGLIKGTLSFSLLNLVFSYSLRYIMIKVFILLSPFAILSLSLNSTSWFFKTWAKNLFALLFIQIIISLILLILFSINYSNDNLFSKFIYIGGIYSLIQANSFVREFIGSVSTTITESIKNINMLKK